MGKKRKILHILKDERDQYPLGLIQQTTASCDASILLIQNAVRIAPPELKGDIFVLSDDLPPTESTPYRTIEYQAMLDLIFESDTVITW